MGSKLFVGNLDFATTRAQLEELFGEVGTVVDVFLPSDRATGRPRGFAFVELDSPEAAEQAITRFHGHELGGRQLRVNLAEDRPPRRGPTMDVGGAPSFGGPPRGFGGGKPKGSRRNLRARKRSL